MAHVAQWKYGEIEGLTSLLTTSKIVGIADIGGIPAPQLQKMRQNLREKAQIRAAKNSLILRALEEAGKSVKGIEGLKEGVKGQAVIIATDMNPFSLFKEIKATRANAPAKGGETASHDIQVKAGDTPFKPGPVVGELQKAGFPAAIQEGKVVLREDKVLVEAGQKIPADVAQLLTRLEIFPVEIGMNLQAVFEDGSVFKPDVLDIDMDAFRSQLQQASSYAYNLAMESAWINKMTIEHLVCKAHMNAQILALERNILTKDNIGHLLSKAHTSMLSLASQAQDALDDDLKKNLT